MDDTRQAGALGLGVVPTTDDALNNFHSEASMCLSRIGLLHKAQLWENTAVPKLRVQVEKLATKLLAETAGKYV